MTFSEKMEVIEAVWDDVLSYPEEAEWPAWHEAYLNKVQQEIDNGTAEFMDFETAKKMLLEETL